MGGSGTITNGFEYVVNLAGVTNGQKTTVMLAGINETASKVTPTLSATVGILLADVNANRAATSADVSLVKAQVAAGGAVGPTNFRDDVNANGATTSADVSLTKAQVAAGAQLPTPP
jgi:hypothetical protein